MQQIEGEPALDPALDFLVAKSAAPAWLAKVETTVA
jgi:hypothetical protein